MTDVDDLVTWLREQITEDRAAVEVGRSPHAHGCNHVECCCDQSAAVLAQCDAHEAILNAIFAYEYKIDGEWGCCHEPESIEAGRCPATNPNEIPAVRALALAYQHRPGYREEWRP